MITQQQYAQPQHAVTPQQGAQQQQMYGSLPQQPSQYVSQPSNYAITQNLQAQNMDTTPTQHAPMQQQYVNNVQPAGQNPAQMQPYNQPYTAMPQQDQLPQQQYQQPMQQAPQQYQQQAMPQQPQYSGQAPAQGQYSQPQGQAPQKYRPPAMEGARRAGGGQISKFVKWDNEVVGTQYFGTFLKFIKSQYNHWNAVIEDDAGQEILLGTPGKLRYLLHSENIIPGKYICVTYLGKEQMKKNRLNVPQKDAHDFTLDIFDGRDKSSDPRFFNEIEKVRAYYASLGNNQVQQAQAQPVTYGAPSYGQTPYGQAPTQYQQSQQPVQQQYAPQQYAQPQVQQQYQQPMPQPQQPGYAPQQFNTGDVPF
jgi:hypothetical protein